MRKTGVRLTALLLGLLLLPPRLAAPAGAKNVLGVEVGMASYAIDTRRIYQGGKYKAELKIGENMTFSGELTEGLPHDKLWACIDRALAEEHLTRQDVIETNKMVADLLKKMKNPKNFWEEVDFYAEVLGVKVYVDTAKSLAGSAMDAGEGLYQNVTAAQRAFIRQELDRELGRSLGDWAGGKSGDGVKKRIENSPTDYKMIQQGLEAVPGVKYIDKAYKVLSGAWKIVEREDRQSKDFKALKDQAMKRQLLVEKFYKRAGDLVRDYLRDFGQWQLTVGGADGGKIERMTKLSFESNDMAGNFHPFYTIQPIQQTWSANAFFTKAEKTDSPNGVYSGYIAVAGEYDVSTLQSHIVPLLDRFEQFSLAQSFAMGDLSNMRAQARSAPMVKQTWRVDECSIEILGLKENGAAAVQLPELVEEKHITIDYEVAGSHTADGYTYTGYDELCTPENAAMPLMPLPDTYRGEVCDWVCQNVVKSHVKGGSGSLYLDETWPAEPYDDGYYGSVFRIRAPFADFTGYKRIEIGKN